MYILARIIWGGGILKSRVRGHPEKSQLVCSYAFNNPFIERKGNGDK